MILILLVACSPSSDALRHAPKLEFPAGDTAPESGESVETDETRDTGHPWDTALPPDTGTDEDPCGFGWDDVFVASPLPPSLPHPTNLLSFMPPTGVGAIAHIEPAPRGYRLKRGAAPPMDIVLPDYEDDMPLFERAGAWTAATRCYETPNGALDLTESEAWDLYRDLAETTTGVPFDASDGHRTVVGLRGAYPGTFRWHGNAPNLFNDTLVLLWREGGQARVRELPINTDTGAYDFGEGGSSSLRPNRRYHYENGWHRSYNALAMDESGYHSIDDTNANGHWDSDRNGWLGPADGIDYDRVGSGHNIHMASVDGPLGTAHVDNWSAGCQTIPGMANWETFIDAAWEGSGSSAEYFLLDVRDLAPEVWNPCKPDGSHACPYILDAFPLVATGDTSTSQNNAFDIYNCSAADESGPEVVYAFTLDQYTTIEASVASEAGVDVDIHLLEGDDPDACLTRDDTDLSWELSPGRYFIVVDTYVDGAPSLAGEYTLRADLGV